jgi:hypothetical protein
VFNISFEFVPIGKAFYDFWISERAFSTVKPNKTQGILNFSITIHHHLEQQDVQGET